MVLTNTGHILSALGSALIMELIQEKESVDNLKQENLKPADERLQSQDKLFLQRIVKSADEIEQSGKNITLQMQFFKSIATSRMF
jgi:hypothetical protein